MNWPRTNECDFYTPSSSQQLYRKQDDGGGEFDLVMILREIATGGRGASLWSLCLFCTIYHPSGVPVWSGCGWKVEAAVLDRPKRVMLGYHCSTIWPLGYGMSYWVVLLPCCSTSVWNHWGEGLHEIWDEVCSISRYCQIPTWQCMSWVNALRR